MCVRKNFYSAAKTPFSEVKGFGFQNSIVLIFYNLHTSFLTQFQGKIVGVAFLVDYLFDTAVDDHFGADGTGLVRNVNGCVVNRNAEFGSLNYGILFGVHGVTHFLSGPRGDIEFFP